MYEAMQAALTDMITAILLYFAGLIRQETSNRGMHRKDPSDGEAVLFVGVVSGKGGIRTTDIAFRWDESGCTQRWLQLS